MAENIYKENIHLGMGLTNLDNSRTIYVRYFNSLLMIMIPNFWVKTLGTQSVSGNTKVYFLKFLNKTCLYYISVDHSVRNLILQHNIKHFFPCWWTSKIIFNKEGYYKRELFHTFASRISPFQLNLCVYSWCILSTLLYKIPCLCWAKYFH